MNISCKEYQETCSKLFELFNKKLQIQIPCDKVSPSFRWFIQATLDGIEILERNLLIDAAQKVEYAEYFLENAISRPYLRARMFAGELVIMLRNEAEPVEYKVGTEIVKIIRNTFDNFEVLKSKRPAVGFTKFICELFKTNRNIISRREFIEYSKKMHNFVLKKRSKCYAICFFNFVHTIKADSYLREKILPTMKSTIDEMLQSFDLSEGEFTDEILDELERENASELKSIK